MNKMASDRFLSRVLRLSHVNIILPPLHIYLVAKNNVSVSDPVNTAAMVSAYKFTRSFKSEDQNWERKKCPNSDDVCLFGPMRQ